MNTEELLAYLYKRLTEIHQVASVPYKATGKMAHITDLADQCLEVLQYSKQAPS